MSPVDDDDADRLRELAQQLPYERPDADRREAVRSSLLLSAARPARSSRRWLLAGGGFVAGAIAAAAIAMIVISPREPAQQHARIDAPPNAQLERVVAKTASGTDELVRVRAGVVRLSVPAVKRGDRVRTKTGDAEVEGTGAYEVAVVDDKLQRVTVDAGTARIDLRVEGKQIFLAAGETWRPTVVTAQFEPPATAPEVEPAPVVEPANPPKPVVVESPKAIVEEAPRMPAVTTLEPAPATKRQTSKTEQHFQRGWALLRDGHAAEAAVELGAAADADERDPLAADARYFQAVALVRSGKTADAENVLVAFLDHAPTSLRRGRAAILLGKLLRDRGDAKSARAWFESALTDGDPAIAAAAKAHLDALSPR